MSSKAQENNLALEQREAQAFRDLWGTIFNGLDLSIGRRGDGSLIIVSGDRVFSVNEGTYEYFMERLREEADEIKKRQ